SSATSLLLSHPPPAALSTLSLHDALPILGFIRAGSAVLSVDSLAEMRGHQSWVFSFVTEVNLAVYRNRSEFTSWTGVDDFISRQDRKSTRLNSSHVKISYAVFCLKKKKST